MRNRPGPNNRVSAWNRRGRGPENNVCRVAPFLFSQYIARMLWRVRSSPLNAPAAFVHPRHPIVAKQPPTSGKGKEVPQRSLSTRIALLALGTIFSPHFRRD